MIGEDIFANLQNDAQYREWFENIMNEGRNYESPFGVNPNISGKPSAQDISNSYMLMKQRRPFVIEYYKDQKDTQPTSIRMYINPEKLNINNNKVISKQFTRGGIFYHHYGADHSTLSLSGTTGLSGMAGIKQLEEAYYASGTLLKYKNYTPTQIYGSVTSFDVIDYTDPIKSVERAVNNGYSKEMIRNTQQNIYEINKEDTDLNLLYNCIDLLEIHCNNNELNKLLNDVIPKISSQINVWKQDKSLTYRTLNQKVIDTLKKEMPGLSDEVIVPIAHEMSISEKYSSQQLLDKKESINNTKITAIPTSMKFKKMRNDSLMEHINRIKEYENRDKKIRDYLRSGLINISEELKDPWLPRQMTIYFENRAYIGHFDSFNYTRDAKSNLITYELKYTVTKQYEFNNETDFKISSNSSGIITGGGNSGNNSSGKPVQKPDENLYTVQQGDTLQSISRKFYGTIDHWCDIFAVNLNKIENANIIYPGQQLKIPPYSAFNRLWVVEEGDSLSSIAKRFYGDASQWKRIYDINPEITNPNLIYPRQVLKIII